MATVEELKARRDALEKAMDSGVREVEYNGTRHVYRSMGEMKEALARLNARIGSSAPVSKIVISSSKGL